MKPRIAIPIPTVRDLEYNQTCWPQYAAAVEQAGGEPVAVELAQPESALRKIAQSCDGFCLPGSPADVDPVRYAAEPDPATAAADPMREAVDTVLVEEAERAGKPVLGICFGLQFLNVLHGGSLVQDLTPVPVNHSAGAAVAIAHSVLIPRNSALASLLTPEEALEADDMLRLPVNSSHHQAASAPGDGLRIVARCLADGVIEALESDPAILRAPIFAVQWHPERSTGISAASRALFRWLIETAAANADSAPPPSHADAI